MYFNVHGHLFQGLVFSMSSLNVMVLWARQERETNKNALQREVKTHSLSTKSNGGKWGGSSSYFGSIKAT